MVHSLSHAFARLKSEVVDYHKGKVELESMDDVLPLSIYCLVYSNLTTACSFYQYMLDFVKQTP